MRRSVLLLLAAITSTAAGAAVRVSLKVVPDRATCIYAVGETAVISVAVEDGHGKRLSSGRLAYVVDNFGAVTNAPGRIVDLSAENPFRVEMMRTNPGFSRLKVRAATGGLSLCGAVDGEYVYGVAFDPGQIRPGTPAPADFDAFWAESMRKLEESVPLDPRIEIVDEESQGACHYFRVSFATCGDRRVFGWLSEPKDALGGPYPVRIRVPGAGVGTMIGDRDANAVVLTMNVHTYPQPEKLGVCGDRERRRLYDAQAREYASPDGVAAYYHAGIHRGREQYFYYGAILGINRAIDWTLTRPLSDRRNVTYSGTSQGGGFGLILAGLNPGITRCHAYVPALADLLGYKEENRQSGWPRLVEAQRPENRAAAEHWAPYFCGVNFARRITCPIQFVVGFSDMSCPPCAVYSAYNVCPAKEKRIINGVGMGHSVFSWLRCEPGTWEDGYTTVSSERCWTDEFGFLCDARLEGDYIARFEFRPEDVAEWRFMELRRFFGKPPAAFVYGKPLAAGDVDFPEIRCGCFGWAGRKVELKNIRVRTYSPGPVKDASDGRDLVIYGSTPAAVTAAIAAKRMGRSVVIVSPETHVGGLTVSGLGFTDSGNTSTIGGLAREFYRRIYREYEKCETWRWQDRATFTAAGQRTPAICEADRTMWTFEPHVAEKVIGDWLMDAGVEVVRNEWLDRGADGRSTNGVEMVDGRLVSFLTLSGRRYRGRMFVDATYEGDLMAAAGVPYRLGREGASEYGEEWNGNQPRQFHHDHYFKKKISAYRIPGDPSSGLCQEIGNSSEGVRGAGDDLIQAYCYRLCMTDCPENRIPFARPEGYDPNRYELLRRVYAAGYDETFAKFDRIPNRKTDTNNHGPMNADYIGGSGEWPEATYQRRAELSWEHRLYQEGLYYFIANDLSVPADVRHEMSRWGLSKDEFADNGYWPYHLYVREGRRMLGEYVMTEHDCMRRQPHLRQGTKKGVVAMGSYCLDSHNVRRYVTADGCVQNEGDVGVDPPGPYPIDFGSIVPRRDSCCNLIVPVALSASHIAFGSIRMEPVFFELGQVAGTASALALEVKCAVQDVPYAKLRKRLLEDGQVLDL